MITYLNQNKIYLRLVRHPQDVFSKHETFVESHRGVNREIFQNTVPAVERAIQYGVESFETDVWLTKDNVLVILHGGILKSNIPLNFLTIGHFPVDYAPHIGY